MDFGRCAVAVDVKYELDALACGAARVGFLAEPILIDGALHGIKIVSVTLAKCVVLDSENSLAVAVLRNSLGNLRGCRG